MILTTTNSIENQKIVDYLGIVTGTCYDSGYSHKNSKMSFIDMLSTSKYNEKYSEGLEAIKETAFQKLKENAIKLGANAIVGIKLDIELVANKSFSIVSITGTAVKVQ